MHDTQGTVSLGGCTLPTRAYSERMHVARGSVTVSLGGQRFPANLDNAPRIWDRFLSRRSASTRDEIAQWRAARRARRLRK